MNQTFSNTPICRRNVHEFILGIPDQFETRSEDMPFHEYVIMGRNKQIGLVQQAVILRTDSKGFILNYVENLKQMLLETFDDLVLYDIKQTFTFKKLSDKHLSYFLTINDACAELCK